MTAQIQSVGQNWTNGETSAAARSGLAKVGGAAAVGVVLTVVAEMLITFLPGGYTTAETVVEWFALLQSNWFLGLRNLGLLNIIMTTLGIAMTYALYAAHRKGNPAFAALAMIVSFMGVSVFFATNRAFPMLDLSMRYAAATTELQRSALEAAGQALLAVGQSHTPGTFLAFFLSELGGILMAVVMLRGKVFSKAAALAGLIGYGFLFVYEILASFVPSSHDAALILAMIGGISNVVWYVLVAVKLFQLGRGDRADAQISE